MLDVDVDDDTAVEEPLPPPAPSPAVAATSVSNRPHRARRFAERLLLGMVMSVIATLLDRRLRRMFVRR